MCTTFGVEAEGEGAVGGRVVGVGFALRKIGEESGTAGAAVDVVVAGCGALIARVCRAGTAYELRASQERVVIRNGFQVPIGGIDGVQCRAAVEHVGDV